ncbi:hypothetical protein [Antrihabitans stalactiti]|uniref:Transcriptional regulator, AbiEi antitoxin, Type IV TA system n=1 Tax=Antrihabitans stalactiti TaxID=2584121 RepID=A0A848KBN3_9NOCA|nr:hypothetical protein [Antrihabitans stalactiti]NMN95721.1 hypothetical protein [Antrihabitans stalactiti]
MELDGGEVLRRQHALRSGIADHEIRGLYTRAGWRRLGHGAYVAESAFTGLDQHAKHRLLLDATLPALSSDSVLSHQSVAVAYGLPIRGLPLDAVHVTRDRETGNRVRPTLNVHCSPLGGEVVELDGRLLTTPARMIVDLGRTAPLEAVLVTADAAVREFGVTASDLAIELERAKNRSGIAAARRLVDLVDGHSESVGESLSRLMLRSFGFTGFKTQGNVYLEHGRLLGRVDFYDEELGVLGEFDGEVKYGRLLKPGQDPGEVVFREKQREDAMRDPGFQMARWIWRELDKPATAARIERALERGRASSKPIGYIVQAPLPTPRRLVRRSL